MHDTEPGALLDMPAAALFSDALRANRALRYLTLRNVWLGDNVDNSWRAR